MDRKKHLSLTLVVLCLCISLGTASVQMSVAMFKRAAHVLGESTNNRLDRFETFASSNVTDTCTKAAKLFEAAARLGTEEWASIMKESDGKLDGLSGFLSGNLHAVGAYDQCLRVKATNNLIFDGNMDLIGKHDFDAQYCRLRWNKGVIYDAGIGQGVCVPATCSESEVQKLYQPEIHVEPLKNRFVNCGAKPDLKTNTGAIVSIVVLSLFGLWVLLATCYDLIKMVVEEVKQWDKDTTEIPTINPTAETPVTEAEIPTINKTVETPVAETNGANGSVAMVTEPEEKVNLGATDFEPVMNGGKGDIEMTDTSAISSTKNLVPSVIPSPHQEKKKPSTLLTVFRAFSLVQNIQDLLSTRSPRGAYKCMNGLRTIAMTWIVLGHTYKMGTYINMDPKEIVVSNFFTQQNYESRFLHYVIRHMDLSVEIFFVLGASLAMVSFMKTMVKLQDKLEDEGRCRKVLVILKEYGLYVLNRYWRLTPVVAILAMIWTNLFYYFGNGPLFPTNYIPSDNCKKTWWILLTYLQNFLGLPNACIGWCWYLANDFQFYLLVPIFAALFTKSAKLGGAFAGVVWAIIYAIRFTLIFKLGDWQLDYYQAIYVKPYTRYGPYITGMVLGYLLYRTKCKVKIHKGLVALGWILATLAALTAVFGDYKRDCGVPNCTPWPSNILYSLYQTSHRDLFALAVAWVIFACCTGYGGFMNRFFSLNLWVPLTKLCYTAYLVHIMIITVALFNRRKLLYVQDITMLYLYFGNMALTILVSFGVSLVFEMPFAIIGKAILPRRL